MVASWEMLSPSSASVLVGILHTETVPISWAFGLRNLIIPNGGIIGTCGMPFDMARNSLVQQFLTTGASHLFFLDSDVIPPRDAILRLLSHRKPLISGLYCRRSPPATIPVMLRGGQWVTELPKEGEDTVVEVDLVGAGCLLMSRELLANCPPQRPGHHWFDWKVNYRGLQAFPDNECLSEDFTFNVHVKKKMGIPTLVDTSIRCRHIGLAQATYMKLEPCQADTVT